MENERLLELRIHQIAARDQLSVDQLRLVLGEFIEALHELEFKPLGVSAMSQVYFSLGDKSAWHYMGLGMELLDPGYQYIEDARRDRVETAQRLDSNMSRFSPILDTWKKESQDYALD